jgi:protein involved in polysaccharide export with SLBB domain
LIACLNSQGLVPMKLFWKLSGLALLACGTLLAGAMLTGCVSSSEDPIFSENPATPSPTMTGSPDDTVSSGADAARFHVGETVIVNFSGMALEDEAEMPASTQTIKEDGTITLPYIGSIKAAGKTPGELQNDIHDAYVPQYYVRLTIAVTSDQRVYYVGGEVKTPGRELYVGATTVTQAIQSAGDFTDFANRSKVLLIRADGQRIKVNCNKALQDPSQDLPVYPGDQIQVPRRLW